LVEEYRDIEEGGAELGAEIAVDQGQVQMAIAVQVPGGDREGEAVEEKVLWEVKGPIALIDEDDDRVRDIPDARLHQVQIPVTVHVSGNHDQSEPARAELPEREALVSQVEEYGDRRKGGIRRCEVDIAVAVKVSRDERSRLPSNRKLQ